MTLQRPEQVQVDAAVRTLLRWTGDDPQREGLIDTPRCVVCADSELFAGYDDDPSAVLNATFEETGHYDEMVLVCNVLLESHCVHCLAPILCTDSQTRHDGSAAIGMIPFSGGRYE